MTLIIESKPVPLRVNADGVILVGKTRVPLDTIVYAFRNGDTAEEIVGQYDILKLSDVYAVIAYYLNNQDKVNKYIERREEEARIIRRENEKRFPRQGLREKLLDKVRVSTIG